MCYAEGGKFEGLFTAAKRFDGGGPMLQVKQFRFAADNLGYLIHGREEAMAVDGGAAEAIASCLDEMKLTLRYVASTHNHPDHTSGNALLVNQYGAVPLNPDALPDGYRIGLEHHEIAVFRTPGHTDDSVCFYTKPYLFTGDTLFNGTVGNCFSGDDGNFHRSVKRIMALPGRTIICAGHDYVRDALAFAKTTDPDPDAFDHCLRRYDPAHVFSRLDEELRVNPYLRFNDPKLVAILKEKGLPAETEWQRWQSLMTLE